MSIGPSGEAKNPVGGHSRGNHNSPSRAPDCSSPGRPGVVGPLTFASPLATKSGLCTANAITLETHDADTQRRRHDLRPLSEISNSRCGSCAEPKCSPRLPWRRLRSASDATRLCSACFIACFCGRSVSRIADRIVMVSERATQFPILSVSWKNFRDWNRRALRLRSSARRVCHSGAYRQRRSGADPRPDDQRKPAAPSRRQPHRRSPITTADDQPASPAVVLLGYGLWQRRYGGRSRSSGTPSRSITQTLYGRWRSAQGLSSCCSRRRMSCLRWDRGPASCRTTARGTPASYAIARLKTGVSLARRARR